MEELKKAFEEFVDATVAADEADAAWRKDKESFASLKKAAHENAEARIDCLIGILEEIRDYHREEKDIDADLSMEQ